MYIRCYFTKDPEKKAVQTSRTVKISTQTAIIYVKKSEIKKVPAAAVMANNLQMSLLKYLNQ